MNLPTRWIAALLVVGGGAALIGCGGSPWTPDPEPDMELVSAIRGGSSEGGDSAGEGNDAPASTGSGFGTLKGKFVFQGAPPSPTPLTVTKDQEVCGGHGLVDEALVVGDGGGLANVVVFLRSKNPRVHESFEQIKDATVVLDNKNCRFEPHVLPMLISQTLEIKNSDAVGHNSNISPIGDAAANPLINGNSSVTHQFNREQGAPVPVTCSIHPWMKGYILPRSNPYFAVTDKDGNFTIENVPAGEELEFQVWHEKAPSGLDAVPGSSKGRFTVTIPENGEEDLGVIEVAPARLN